MVTIKINVLPFVACFFLFVAFIFCIVGAASDDEGWCKNDTFDVGWKRGCVSHVGCASLENDLEDAGNAAIAGSIIGILGTFVAFCVCVVCGIGIFQVITAIVGAVLSLVTGLVVALCWILWVGISSDERSDFDLDPDYAFALSIIASIFCFFATCIMGAAVKFPITVMTFGGSR
eukprot:TRINITY_DN1952_c0_g1_i1.p1 TRINITY_DN1952_c0_g1~~TRINITY_DN1952_c0_g1_i1.p1  ORF type:complete len:175 (-),score=33.00 TRINITY_DN1952_c0_g1_i1:38-562(-)